MLAPEFTCPTTATTRLAAYLWLIEQLYVRRTPEAIVAAVDPEYVGFDPFRDRDFAFAREQWDHAHFAQVESNRIVCLFKRARGEIELHRRAGKPIPLGWAVDGGP